MWKNKSNSKEKIGHFLDFLVHQATLTSTILCMDRGNIYWHDENFQKRRFWYCSIKNPIVLKECTLIGKFAKKLQIWN